MEDIPKTAVVALQVRTAVAVENDDTNEVLAQEKRIEKFVEKQARLAITGLPGRNAKQRSTTQHNLRNPDRKTRITIKEKLPTKGKSRKIMGSGWDTTECPTTTDNIAQPEATPREETSNTPRPRTSNQEARSQTPTPPSRESQQNEVEHGQQTPTRRHDVPQLPKPVDPLLKHRPQPSPQQTSPESEEEQDEFSTCPRQPVQDYHC